MTADPPPASAPDRGDDRAKAQADPKAAPTGTGADASASGPTLRGSARESVDDQQALQDGRQSLRPGDVTLVSGGPNQTVQLSAHIDAQLCSEDPPDARDRLTGLAKDRRFRDALGPDPRPSEVAGLAGLLVAHVRGKIKSEDEVTGHTSALLDRRIADWFSELQEPARREGTERVLRRAAMRIALAVFDDLPRHLATTAGAELGDRAPRGAS